MKRVKDRRVEIEEMSDKPDLLNQLLDATVSVS
jgi:hypothetical protein